VGWIEFDNLLYYSGEMNVGRRGHYYRDFGSIDCARCCRCHHRFGSLSRFRMDRRSHSQTDGQFARFGSCASSPPRQHVANPSPPPTSGWDQVPMGEGTFGHVFLATSRRSGERVAFKRIPKSLASREDFQREMEALLRIQKWGGHPHICALREHFEDGWSDEAILTNEDETRRRTSLIERSFKAIDGSEQARKKLLSSSTGNAASMVNPGVLASEAAPIPSTEGNEDSDGNDMTMSDYIMICYLRICIRSTFRKDTLSTNSK
jgi:hypothetical protein